MSHYLIHIPMDAKDVKVIREQFQEFLERAEAITVRVSSPDGQDPSEELQDAIRGVFLHVLIALTHDMFEGLQ